MKIGSDEHKELFCRSFIDSHLAYDPRELAWPDLDDRSLAFLHAVPVWGSAFEVEVNAGNMLETFAATQRDPLVREALELQGHEETRHGVMLSTLFERASIRISRVDPSIRSGKSAFVSFGYDECLDSFFGFGIFRIAREANVVSEALINVFARVLIEEARHIVFFVNWIAYDRAKRGLGAEILQAPPTAFGYAQALFKTIRRGKSANAQGRGMAVALDVFAGLTLERFLRTCLEENDRYMEAFDPRLLRPRVVPALVRYALRMLPKRTRMRSIVGESSS
ncbi:MAG TPA: hypothetical protein VJP85_09325 [Candidatus Baltobacteraceae bacterium]|nr:hypothetical protein [Candidatus Baltobacteraceae bacterium]